MSEKQDSSVQDQNLKEYIPADDFNPLTGDFFDDTDKARLATSILRICIAVLNSSSEMTDTVKIAREVFKTEGLFDMLDDLEMRSLYQTQCMLCGISSRNSPRSSQFILTTSHSLEGRSLQSQSEIIAEPKYFSSASHDNGNTDSDDNGKSPLLHGGKHYSESLRRLSFSNHLSQTSDAKILNVDSPYKNLLPSQAEAENSPEVTVLKENLNTTNNEGNSALTLAWQNKEYEIFSILLCHGASVPVSVNDKDENASSCEALISSAYK